MFSLDIRQVSAPVRDKSEGSASVLSPPYLFVVSQPQPSPGLRVVGCWGLPFKDTYVPVGGLQWGPGVMPR